MQKHVVDTRRHCTGLGQPPDFVAFELRARGFTTDADFAALVGCF